MADKTLQEHRKHLVDARQKAFEDFDKTIIALGGGALGISVTFVKDLLGPGEISLRGLLLWAWLCWVLCLLTVLSSYFVSQRALDTAIAQLDSKDVDNSAGGFYSTVTHILNISGALEFLVGLILFIVFVYANLEVLKVSNQNKPASQPSSTSNSQPAPSNTTNMVIPTPTVPSLPSGATHGYVPAAPPPTSAPRPTSKPKK
jgi:hypothetical protein